MRIVVVEDEAPIREGMAKLLSKINPEYELVGKAADGEAGYQLIRELNPDLVIMDNSDAQNGWDCHDEEIAGGKYKM